MVDATRADAKDISKDCERHREYLEKVQESRERAEKKHARRVAVLSLLLSRHDHNVVWNEKQPYQFICDRDGDCWDMRIFHRKKSIGYKRFETLDKMALYLVNIGCNMIR